MGSFAFPPEVPGPPWPATTEVRCLSIISLAHFLASGFLMCSPLPKPRERGNKMGGPARGGKVLALSPQALTPGESERHGEGAWISVAQLRRPLGLGSVQLVADVAPAVSQGPERAVTAGTECQVRPGGPTRVLVGRDGVRMAAITAAEKANRQSQRRRRPRIAGGKRWNPPDAEAPMATPELKPSRLRTAPCTAHSREAA